MRGHYSCRNWIDSWLSTPTCYDRAFRKIKSISYTDQMNSKNF